MKKLFITLAVLGIVTVGFNPPMVQAASQYVPVTICHANTDGTYTQLSLLFPTAGDAQRLYYGGVAHINDKGKDIWPPFTWSGQYTQLNVPGSLWYIGGYKVDTVHRAIYNNGCVAP